MLHTRISITLNNSSFHESKHSPNKIKHYCLCKLNIYNLKGAEKIYIFCQRFGKSAIYFYCRKTIWQELHHEWQETSKSYYDDSRKQNHTLTLKDDRHNYGSLRINNLRNTGRESRKCNQNRSAPDQQF